MLGKLIRQIKSHFEPRLATVEPLGKTFEVASDQTLLQGALAAGLAFPHHCTVGTCGNCKCRLKSGDVRSMTDASLTLTPAELADGYILACQCLLKSEVTVAVDLNDDSEAMVPAQYMGTIVATEQLTHDIGVLGILPPNIAKTAAGRASCGFWRPITYRLSAGSHQSIPLNPQVLAIHLSVRMCIYPGG